MTTIKTRIQTLAAPIQNKRENTLQEKKSLVESQAGHKAKAAPATNSKNVPTKPKTYETAGKFGEAQAEGFEGSATTIAKQKETGHESQIQTMDSGKIEDQITERTRVDSCLG